MDSIGLDAIVAHERELGERFLEGLPGACALYGLPTMEGRVPTFCFTVEGRSPVEVATRLGEHGYAVWHGNYYAVEVMERLGLPDGAVRAGIVHYNTAEEVDGLLEELRAAVRLLVLGGTKFLGRAAVEAALARGHEVTLFNRGETNPELFPEAEKLRGDRDGDLSALEGREWDAVIDPSGYVPRVVRDFGGAAARRRRPLRVRLQRSRSTRALRAGLRRGRTACSRSSRARRRCSRSTPTLKAACERVLTEVLPGVSTRASGPD